MLLIKLPISWTKSFEEGEGRKIIYQVEAFLVYWLSYFVYPSCHQDGLQSYVFALAVMLVKRKRFALATLYLGSLYARLDKCLHNIFRSVSRYDVVLYSDASFLQMFLWERFGASSPKLV